jgi:predicted regulator of Ras-like GTPase activity (Roadblock/LC7/MglB family)
VPYKRLLEDLVRGVRGVEGALLLDSEGEVVVQAGDGDARHRLIAAYQGIALATARRTLSRFGSDAVRAMECRYERGTVILRPLKDGYYVVVAVAAGAAPGEAHWRSEAVRELLDREI